MLLIRSVSRLHVWPLLGLAIALSATGCTYHLKETALLKSVPTAQASFDKALPPPWQAQATTMIGSGNLALHGATFTRPDARATVIYFGGNGFTVARAWRALLEIYRSAPVNVVVYDYRGTGANSGTMELQSVYADALALHDRVAQDSSLPVLVHGHSFGSLVAGHVARERRLDGLVLEASSTTVQEAADHAVRKYSAFVKVRMSPTLEGQGNLALMSQLDEPLLIVSGGKDTLAPTQMAQALHDAATLAPEGKELLVVPNAGHNGSAFSPLYIPAFIRLLDRVAP